MSFSRHYLIIVEIQGYTGAVGDWLERMARRRRFVARLHCTALKTGGLLGSDANSPENRIRRFFPAGNTDSPGGTGAGPTVKKSRAPGLTTAKPPISLALVTGEC